ncbi:MAG TPA: GIY-YIG nuclease family protein [Candidatus Absconditabacterales bacterium]|nr:GIY-YIG nuclease family protein [Candidatus Absconditabacterales bacterium]
MFKGGYVYIITNRRNGTLYTGVTNSLRRRVGEHKSQKGNGFTARYGLEKLVYYEKGDGIEEAIMREKEIKGMSRNKKIMLIENLNPQWKDLSEGWY